MQAMLIACLSSSGRARSYPASSAFGSANPALEGTFASFACFGLSTLRWVSSSNVVLGL
jgi:hypothetical protein